MLDDGVKGAGKDDSEIKVGDIAIHLLDAIENGERSITNQNSLFPRLRRDFGN